MVRKRGELTSSPDRQILIELVESAIKSGSSKEKACEIVGISSKTYDRWLIKAEDGRTTANRSTPKNKLSLEEERKIIETINLPKYANLPPSQIVPKLADEGVYLASESTFYRVMKKHNQLKHRGSAKEPVKKVATTHVATSSNQVWTWDIT